MYIPFSALALPTIHVISICESQSDVELLISAKSYMEHTSYQHVPEINICICIMLALHTSRKHNINTSFEIYVHPQKRICIPRALSMLPNYIGIYTLRPEDHGHLLCVAQGGSTSMVEHHHMRSIDEPSS